MSVLREGKIQLYLLSDHIWIMAGFDLERAIVGPQVDRGCYARDSPFEDLESCQHRNCCTMLCATYHFCSLRARNGEFQVGIFLPVSKE